MSTVHPQSPSTRLETSTNPEAPTLVTANGVSVFVNHPPPPEPQRQPESPEPAPKVVIAPPELSRRERDALMAKLYAEHGEFILMVLRGHKDISPASAEELQQDAFMTLCEHIEREMEPPKKVRAFLRSVLHCDVIDHLDLWKPPIQEGADADALLSPEEDPEGTAELAERRRKLDRYVPLLPEVERNVIRCIDLFEMTFAQTAKALGLAVGSVATLHAHAKRTLEDFALASKRATILGALG